METQTCPKCAYPQLPGALECPACGIIFAKYQRGAQPASPAQAPAVPTETLNPYAPPQMAVDASLPPPPPLQALQGGPAGVWRDGDVLVLQQGAQLPDRCVVCNRATSNRWRKTFYWAPPALLFLVLLNILIYALVNLAVRKKAELAVPLCPEHDEQRRRKTTLGWFTVIGSFVLMIGSFFFLNDNTGATFGGLFFLGFIALIVGAVLTNKALPLQPRKIDSYYVWMKKAGQEFLVTLPAVPGAPR